MNRLILLSDKTLHKPAKDALIRFTGKDSKNIKIAFSANAADLYTDDQKGYVIAAKNELLESGFGLLDLDLSESKEEILSILDKVDATFFVGGNYYYLMHLFIESGLINEYKSRVSNGLVHIGFSSGAMICSNDFKAYKLIEEKEIHKIEIGLGLFPYYIIPHYTNKQKFTKAYSDILKAGIFNVIPLANNQSIIVEDNTWEIISESI
jgi:peptidase E